MFVFVFFLHQIQFCYYESDVLDLEKQLGLHNFYI